MDEREIRGLIRGTLLLLGISAGRVLWAWAGSAGRSDAPSVLPDLTHAVEVAAAEEELRSRRLEPGETVDPNQAPEAELDRLPGVGPSTARAIVAARDSGAIFRSPEDLTSVRGIGPVLVERVRSHLDLSSAPRRREGAPPWARPPIDLNSADLAELQALPGVGPAIAERIVSTRRRQPFGSLEDLLDVPGIGPVKLERLRPVATVRAAGGARHRRRRRRSKFACSSVAGVRIV